MAVTIDEINAGDPLMDALQEVGPDVKTLVKDLESVRQLTHHRLLTTKTKKLSHNELASLARTLDSLTDTFISFYGLKRPDVEMPEHLTVEIVKFADDKDTANSKNKDPE